MIEHARINFRIYCVTLLILSIWPSVSFSQPLDLQKINQYPQFIVDYSLFAPPYFLVIGREEEKRIFRYYSQEGDTWSVHHEKKIPLEETQTIFYSQANEYLTVIVYETTDNQVHFLSISNSPDSSEYDLERINKNDELHKVILQDRTLYSLTRQSDLFYLQKITYSENMKREEEILASWNAGVFFIDDFAVLGDSLLFVYSLSPNVTLPDTTPSPEGVIVGRLKGNQQIDFDTKKWFYETTKFGDDVIEFQPDSVFVDGTMAFITRKTIVPDPHAPFDPFITNQHELLVVDWSDTANPRLIQTINDSIENWGMPPGDQGIVANSRYLVFCADTSLSYNIVIYQKKDNVWIQATLLKGESGYLSLWNDQLIIDHSSTRIIYDLSQLPNLQEIVSPPNTVFDGLHSYTAINDRLYFVDDWEKNPNLTSIKLSENTPMIPDSRLPLDKGGYYELTTDGSLLAAASNSNPSEPIRIVQLNSDGSLGDQIQSVPLSLEEPHISYTFGPLWNNKVFLFPYIVRIVDESTAGIVFKYIVEIRERNQNPVGNRITQLFPSTEADISHLLIDDRLVIAEFRTFSVDRRDYADNYLLTYSIQNPAQPERISEYSLPFPDGPVTDRKFNRRQVKLAYHPSQKLLAYTDQIRTGVLDFSDPANPKSVGSFLPGGTQVYWAGDRLAVESTTYSELIFYRLTDDFAFTEIGRFGHNLFMESHFWGDWMAMISKGASVNIYRLLINSSVGSWWQSYNF